MILLFFLLLLIIFLQTVFLAFNMALAIVLSLITAGIKKSTLTLIFFTGIFYDLLMSQTIGQTAIFYLIISAVVFVYQQKFKNKNFFFLIILGFLTFSLDSFLFFGGLNISRVFFETVIFLIVYYPLKSVFAEKALLYD